MSRLDGIHAPRDLRRLKPAELPKLAEELRQEVLAVVARSGGFLASNLGVIELTVALHYAFDTPTDRLVWDIGHQTYAHKILTGRRDRMASLRSYGGLSGFLSREESEYDVIAAGHASTSISAGLGLAVARDLKNEKHHVVAVVGDGAMTAGMAFEAMNQAGHLGKRLIVVLNDNSMAITPSVGALTRYVKEIMAGRHYAKLKDDIRVFLQKLPGFGAQVLEVVKGMEEGLRATFTPGSLFEELGFRYFGPVHGHSLPALLAAFADAKKVEGPVLVHVVTQAGKGYSPAEDEPEDYHAPAQAPTGLEDTAASRRRASFTEVFGRTALKLAERDSRIVAITAAMPEGTGLAELGERLPRRFFNTGIAEQHSVTFAAGLALEGLRPLVAVHSTFLQRGYDQIFHDVCLMDLPVVFALDRAGVVDADGPAHHGLFDFAYLRTLPNMVIAAPADENELQHLLATAFELRHPVALRFPAGPGFGVALDEDLRILPAGKAELLRRGKDGTVWAVGATVQSARLAVERLAKDGLDLALVNARFVKPLDRELLASQLGSGGRIATIEEHAVAGGFGSAVLEAISELSLGGVETLCLGVPDRFVPHGSQRVLRRALGLDAEGLYFRLRQFFQASGPSAARGPRRSS